MRRVGNGLGKAAFPGKTPGSNKKKRQLSCSEAFSNKRRALCRMERICKEKANSKNSSHPKSVLPGALLLNQQGSCCAQFDLRQRLSDPPLKALSPYPLEEATRRLEIGARSVLPRYYISAHERNSLVEKASHVRNW